VACPGFHQIFVRTRISHLTSLSPVLLQHQNFLNNLITRGLHTATYIANYTGKSLFLFILIVVLIIVQDRTAIDRLIHIVSVCSSIVTEAFQLCVQHIHQSRDPTVYQALLTAYERTSGALDMPLPNPLDLAQLDTKWMDGIIAKNQAERTKLEVELETYSNNMIKESIRVCACFSPRFFLRLNDGEDGPSRFG